MRQSLYLALFVSVPSLWATDLVLKNVPTQVFFSPNGGAQAAIVETINLSKKTILVQAYSFTSAPIARALTSAHDRGVDVRVILEGRMQLVPHCEIQKKSNTLSMLEHRLRKKNWRL